MYVCVGDIESVLRGERRLAGAGAQRSSARLPNKSTVTRKKRRTNPKFSFSVFTLCCTLCVLAQVLTCSSGKWGTVRSTIRESRAAPVGRRRLEEDASNEFDALYAAKN